MARAGDIFLDQASLKQVIRGLERVFPTHGKQNTAIANGMKKASKPLVTALQQAIDGATSQAATGKLAGSIDIFRAKRLDDNKRPSVYVGPKVKPPSKFKNKKGHTKEQRKLNAQKRKAWAKKQSGFYFYFLEYGFVPFGKGNLRPGLGLLPKVVAEKGTYVNSRMLPYIWAEIKKGAKKNGIQVK